MQGEELYTSGRKWVFYITSRKLFRLPLQIKWSLQRNFLLSALRSEKKKSVFVFISWWWCFGPLRSWRLFFYKLMPYLWWWTSFLYCPVLKNLLILKPENNGPIGMKLCMYAGYNWVEIIYLVCRVWIGTNPYYITSHFEQTYDLLVSTGTRFPFPPWVWGYVWWKLMMMVSVTQQHTTLPAFSAPANFVIDDVLFFTVGW